MGVQTTVVTTCDHPKCLRVDHDLSPELQTGREIRKAEMYVDAMVYGAIFHSECWKAISGPELAKALGLDDITWRREGHDERLDKVIYSPERSRL